MKALAFVENSFRHSFPIIYFCGRDVSTDLPNSLVISCKRQRHLFLYYESADYQCRGLCDEAPLDSDPSTTCFLQW